MFLFNVVEARQLQDVVDLKPGSSILVDQPQGESVLIKLKVENFVHTVLYIMTNQLNDSHIDLQQIHLNDPDAKHYAVIVFKDHDPNFGEVIQTLKYFNSNYEINYLKNLSNPTPYTVDLSQLDAHPLNCTIIQLAPSKPK